MGSRKNCRWNRIIAKDNDSPCACGITLLGGLTSIIWLALVILVSKDPGSHCAVFLKLTKSATSNCHEYLLLYLFPDLCVCVHPQKKVFVTDKNANVDYSRLQFFLGQSFRNNLSQQKHNSVSFGSIRCVFVCVLDGSTKEASAKRCDPRWIYEVGYLRFPVR